MVAPIALKNHEYSRIAAKSRENAGGGGGEVREDSGMFAGIGTAEGPRRWAKRTANDRSSLRLAGAPCR
jgi:hypothetical protein